VLFDHTILVLVKITIIQFYFLFVQAQKLNTFKNRIVPLFSPWKNKNKAVFKFILKKSIKNTNFRSWEKKKFEQ